MSSEIDCSNVFLDPYAQLLIAAMKQSGWYVNYFILCSNIFIVGDQQSFSSSSQTLFVPFSTVFNDRHFSCENCDGCVSGGFDSATSQVGTELDVVNTEHLNRREINILCRWMVMGQGGTVLNRKRGDLD